MLLVKKQFSAPLHSLSPSFTPTAELSPNEFFVGGGGGASKTGIPNMFIRCSIQKPSTRPDITIKEDPLLEPTNSVHAISCHKSSLAYAMGDEIFLMSQVGKVGKPKSVEVGARPTKINFTARGDLVIVGCNDEHVRVYRAPSLELVCEFSGNDQPTAEKKRERKTVKCVDFQPSTNSIACTCETNQVVIFDVDTKAIVKAGISDPESRFRSCHFAKDSDLLFTFTTILGKKPTGAQVWNLATTKSKDGKLAITQASCLKKFKQIANQPITTSAISTSGKLLAIGTASGDVAVFNADASLSQVSRHSPHTWVVTDITFGTWDPSFGKTKAEKSDDKGKGKKSDHSAQKQKQQSVDVVIATCIDASCSVSLVRKGERRGLEIVLFLVALLVILVALFFKKF